MEGIRGWWFSLRNDIHFWIYRVDKRGAGDSYEGRRARSLLIAVEGSVC